MQGIAEVFYSSNDLFAVRATEPVVLVAQILASMPQKQPAVFDVAWCEHELRWTITFVLRLPSRIDGPLVNDE
jgi:hypothetical protein